jgi:hypothetical protein
MSALGQKRTFAVQKVMSALPPKADMCGAASDVRFGPEAVIWSMSVICVVIKLVTGQSIVRRNKNYTILDG